MENTETKKFVSKISALWSEQKRREVLYLEALKKESMSSLRKVLAQGHFHALLCQKEIWSIYDYFKCFHNDGELAALEQENCVNTNQLKDTNNPAKILKLLKTNENKILHSYESLISKLEKESEVQKILDQHLNRISEFYEILSKHESVSREHEMLQFVD